MFGAIVAGRLVYVVDPPCTMLIPAKRIYNKCACNVHTSSAQCRDETHFVFPLEQPYDINHLTVFLLGTGELRLRRCPNPIRIDVFHLHLVLSPDRSPISRRIWRIGPLRMAKRRVYPSRRVSRKSYPREAREDADRSLTNNKPSAIYRLRPHLPSNIPQGQSAPATLGIEIAPISQLEELHTRITGGADGAGTSGTSGKEVVQKVEVGKVAEKVVKNVSVTWVLFSPALLSRDRTRRGP